MGIKLLIVPLSGYFNTLPGTRRFKPRQLPRQGGGGGERLSWWWWVTFVVRIFVRISWESVQKVTATIDAEEEEDIL